LSGEDDVELPQIDLASWRSQQIYIFEGGAEDSSLPVRVSEAIRRSLEHEVEGNCLSERSRRVQLTSLGEFRLG